MHELYASADIVFSGKVISKKTMDIASAFGDDQRVIITVNELFKGPQDGQFEIITSDNTTSCGFYFEEDAEYIIFASEIDGQYKTDLCSGTSPVASGRIEELKSALEAMKSGGTYVNFYATGEFYKYEVPLKNGKTDGLVKGYTKDGRLHSTAAYVAGVLEGPRMTYHENGKVSSESGYKNGEFHGPARVYDHTGKLIYETVYEDGKVISKTDYIGIQ